MKNILVIGGAGFIGSNLTEKLGLTNKYNVTVLLRKTSDPKFLKSKDIRLCYGDMLDKDSLKSACAGVDTVFCLVNVRPAGKSPEEYNKELFLLHTEGTKNLLDACKANNVRRLIYFSSVAAIGYKKGINAYDENSETDPIDAYGKAKLEAEKILNDCIKKREMDVTILRPPGVFGENGLGSLAKIIFFVKKGFVPILGNGENKQSITYVGNVVNEAIFLSDNANSFGKTYITSDDRPYSVNELVDTVAKTLNSNPFKLHIPVSLLMLLVTIVNLFGKALLKREVVNRESIVAISTERIFDGSRIFREFDYKQEYDLTTGVQQTIGWREGKNV